jgi:hypothetical protein
LTRGHTRRFTGDTDVSVVAIGIMRNFYVRRRTADGVTSRIDRRRAEEARRCGTRNRRAIIQDRLRGTTAHNSLGWITAHARIDSA